MKGWVLVAFGLVVVAAFVALFFQVFAETTRQPNNAALIGVLGALAGALGGVLTGVLATLATAWVQGRQANEKFHDRVSAHAIELTRLDYDLRLRALTETGDARRFLAPAKVYRELYRALESLHRDGVWPKSIEELGLLAVFDVDPSKRVQREQLQRQRDLLAEFLGEAAAAFLLILSAGNTGDEAWRREKAQVITDWVVKNRPHFPEQVQSALTGLMNAAGTGVSEEGMQVLQNVEFATKALGWLGEIKAYHRELRSKLETPI